MVLMSEKHIILKGAFILTAVGFINRIIGFFYRIFLSQAIGAEGMGIYQLIFPVYAMTFSLAVSGIQTSISKYVAAKNAVHDRRRRQECPFCRNRPFPGPFYSGDLAALYLRSPHIRIRSDGAKMRLPA